MQGKTVNGYTLQRLLGVGGMAEVWYAENEIGKPAAVKILNQNLSSNPQIVERFHNEALVMVKLSHPNIRQVYGYGYIDNRHCIIMEYLDGNDLETLLKQGRRFTEEELHRWWDQIAHALNYTHSLGIVHRDIKPSNLFLDNWGNIKLLDFGIAKIMESVSLTHTGAVMGTLLYMSPEQVKDSKYINYHTDLYSLAVTFVHLLSGKAPYDADTSHYDIQVSIVTKPLEMDGMPTAWRNFLPPYLEKEPGKRPALQPFRAEARSLSGNAFPPQSAGSTIAEAKANKVETKTNTSQTPKEEAVAPMPKPYQQEQDVPHKTVEQDIATEEEKKYRFKPWLIGLGIFVILFFVTGYYRHRFLGGPRVLINVILLASITYTLVAASIILLIKLIKTWGEKSGNRNILWIIAASSLSVYVLCFGPRIGIPRHVLGALTCLACGFALAALFVYRPKKFKTLPWIVLAVIGICFLLAVYYGDYPVADEVFYGAPFHYWLKLLLLELDGFIYPTRDKMIAWSVPIVALFVLQIVRTIQKKSQNS